MLVVNLVQVSHEERVLFTSFASIRVDAADVGFQCIYDEFVGRGCQASHVVGDRIVVGKGRNRA